MSGIELIEIGDDPKLSEIVEAIAQHNKEFPEHGVACACLDSVASTIRNATTIANLSERLDDAEVWKTQSRIDYVLILGNTNRI